MIFERMITHFVCKRVAQSCFLLTMIFTVFLFLDELKALGQGSYQFHHLIVTLLLSLPHVLQKAFLLGALTGIAFAFGQWNDEQELVALYSLRLSQRTMMHTVTKAVVIIALFYALLSYSLAPYLYKMAKEFKTYHVSSGQMIHTERGLWLRYENDYLHIRASRQEQSRDILEHVTHYHFEEGHLQYMTYAPSIEHQPKTQQWILKQAQRTFLHPKAVYVESLQEHPWELKINPHVLHAVNEAQTQTVTLMDHWRSWQASLHLSMNTKSLHLRVWHMLLKPILFALAMLVMAGLWLKPALRQSITGLRLLFAALAAVTIQTGAEILSSLLFVMGVWPLAAVSAPLLILALLFVLQTMMMVREESKKDSLFKATYQ